MRQNSEVQDNSRRGRGWHIHYYPYELVKSLRGSRRLSEKQKKPWHEVRRTEATEGIDRDGAGQQGGSGNEKESKMDYKGGR